MVWNGLLNSLKIQVFVLGAAFIYYIPWSHDYTWLHHHFRKWLYFIYIYIYIFFFKFKFTSLLLKIRNVFLKRCICNLLMIAESKNNLWLSKFIEFKISDCVTKELWTWTHISSIHRPNSDYKLGPIKIVRSHFFFLNSSFPFLHICAFL